MLPTAARVVTIFPPLKFTFLSARQVIHSNIVMKESWASCLPFRCHLSPPLSYSVRSNSLKLFVAYVKSQRLFSLHTSCPHEISSSWNTANHVAYPQPFQLILAPHHFFVYLTLLWLLILCSCTSSFWKPPGHSCSPGGTGCSSSSVLKMHRSFWILSPPLDLGEIQGLLSTDAQNTTHSDFCICFITGHWGILSPIHLETFPTLTT